jgi:polyisoprenoid-binding protein YceI
MEDFLVQRNAARPDRVEGLRMSFQPGFTATINRHDFGVRWNSTLDRGGAVVGNMVEITIDAEAILQEE